MKDLDERVKLEDTLQSAPPPKFTKVSVLLWEHVIMEDLCVKGLRREVAQNRAEWRSATT